MHIFLEADGFHNTISQSRAAGMGSGATAYDKGEGATKWGQAVQSTVRRPYRGIQIKDDIYAVLSVRKPDGSAIPLTSSSAPYTWSGDKNEGNWIGQVRDYSDFILQRVEDQRMEKQQIIETFGDTFVYFFGERPRMITFSGVLMNTDDFNWRAQFWQNYDLFLRGTKLVQMNARCYLSYDTIVIEGYPLSASAADDADNPYTVQFQMQMLVTNYYEYSSVGHIRFPGIEADTTDVLNAELEKTRKTFVSTGAEVRFKNATAKGPTGFLATMRSVIREVRSFETMAYNYLDIFRNFTSGRYVRLPVGIAAFVSGSETAEVASASVGYVSNILLGQTLGAPSTVAGVPVGHKLKMIGPAKFGPSWVSAVTGKSRGVFYENYDEYPIRPQPSALSELLTPMQMAELEKRDMARVALAKERNATLAAISVAQAGDGIIGEVADVIGFLRNSFSLVTTVAGLISDPLGTITNGLLGITPNQLGMVGRGLLNSAFPPGKFIGTAAGNTMLALFDQKAQEHFREAKIGDAYKVANYQDYNAQVAAYRAQNGVAGSGVNIGAAGADVVYSGTVEADTQVQAGAGAAGATGIPEVYNSNTYRSPTDSYRDRNYEEAYQDSDYAALMELQRQKDQQALEEAAALTEGLAAGNEDAVQAALDDAYGERDTASETVITTEIVEESTVVGRALPEYTTQQAYSERETMAEGEIVTTEEGQVFHIDRVVPEAGLEEVYGPTSTSLMPSSTVKDVFTGTKTRPMTEPEFFAQQAGSQVTPRSIEEVYGGEGVIQKKTLTAEERAALLALVYGGEYVRTQSPQGTEGIVGVDDDDAEIKPVV
jgi:hypothetical protein